MGRVVKGARIAHNPYQVKAPTRPAQVSLCRGEAVPAPVGEPFADAEPSVDAFVERRRQELDVQAARSQAAKLLADAAAEAEQCVKDAQERALKIVDEAQRGVSAIEQQAKELGYEQGLGDGRAAAQAQMDEMLATMRGLVEMARVERHKIIESAEPEIVRLSVTIAERILNAHVAQQRDAVLDMVRSAVTRLVNRETVTVRVNPADLETMRDHRDHLMAMNDIDNLRVIEDQRVDRGGVVIETEAGTIDAKVSTQLREVRRLLAVEEPITLAPSSERALINPAAQAS